MRKISVQNWWLLLLFMVQSQGDVMTTAIWLSLFSYIIAARCARASACTQIIIYTICQLLCASNRIVFLSMMLSCRCAARTWTTIVLREQEQASSVNLTCSLYFNTITPQVIEVCKDDSPVQCIARLPDLLWMCPLSLQSDDWPSHPSHWPVPAYTWERRQREGN